MTSVPLIYSHITQQFRLFLIKTCIYIFCLGTLAACSETVSEHGHSINPTELANIQIGQSNRTDIVNALGWPSFEGAFDKQKLYYVSQTMEAPVAGKNTTKTRTIYIFVLDKNDTLASVDVVDEKSGVTIAHVDEKTPTTGAKFSVIDQIFANFRRRGASE